MVPIMVLNRRCFVLVEPPAALMFAFHEGALEEKAFLDQAGVVLEHLDEKHVAVKMRDQK